MPSSTPPPIDGAGPLAPRPAARASRRAPAAPRRWLRWPSSLLWRTFVLLALLAVATTAAWFLIFRTYEQEPRARQIAQNIVSTVNLTRAALVSAQADRRRELLEELAESERIQVYPSEPGEQIISPPDTPLVRVIEREVRDQLGEGTRFAFQREGLPGLWVSFPIGGDEYWVRVPRERIERRAALQWIGWGAAALFLSLLAAYFIVSHISRPLKVLARAAAEVGRGRLPPSVPESGAAEIRTLSHAFNEMTRDLARLEEDRALILAGVSHDLRTPLARLRLGIEMSGADDSIREGMNADIEQMDRIIGQFLDFAREGETTAEATQKVAIDTLVAEALEHYRKLGRPLHADLASGATLRARPKALRRALTNLIDNALRYGAEPIGVSTRIQARELLIEVADRGPGIPEPETERMKLPFTRLDPARSGSGGSGLGLAIVDRVAQSHGGRLELSPREDGGLVARIALPLAGAR